VYDGFGACGMDDGDGSAKPSFAGGNAGDAIEQHKRTTKVRKFQKNQAEQTLTNSDQRFQHST
jgi:hypothetical protein